MQKPLENQAILWRLRVAIDAPLAVNFDYLAPADATPADVGLRVVVPFGTGRRVGVILAVLPLQGSEIAAEAPDATQLKAAESILRDLPPLPADWINLCLFAASYYQAAPGEALLQAIPTGLRKPDPVKRRKLAPAKVDDTSEPTIDLSPTLTAGQSKVLSDLLPRLDGYSANLLFGITGSGKTEVYLRLIKTVLDQGKQVLLLVPEINLTPLLEARVAQRFPSVPVVSLHSEVTEAARARHFAAALTGEQFLHRCPSWASSSLMKNMTRPTSSWKACAITHVILPSGGRIRRACRLCWVRQRLHRRAGPMCRAVVINDSICRSVPMRMPCCLTSPCWIRDA
jgi:primosomal protein N'